MTFPVEAARSMWRLQLSDGRVLPVRDETMAAPHPKTGHTHEATAELGGTALRVGATSAEEARDRLLVATRSLGCGVEVRLLAPGESA